jgi:hypothetical protein
MKYKTKADVERVIAANKPSAVIETFIQSYLEGLAITPILKAESRYSGLMAQEDVPDVDAVTETRSVLITPTQYEPIEGTEEYEVIAEAVYEDQEFVVSEAYSANTVRDNEIASLVLAYPHVVEPEQTYSEVERIGGEGLIYFETVPDVMPTLVERRPELVLDDVKRKSLMLIVLENAVDSHIDKTVQASGYGIADSIGKYIGYENTYQSECETFGKWVAACYDKCYELLDIGELLTVDELIKRLPVYEL